MKVEASLLGQDLALEVGARELDDPGPGEVLVRVEWAGICGSDLHVFRSGIWVEYWPATLGHEVAGVVEATGPEVGLSPGERVVLDSRLPCLECPECAVDPDRCARITFLGESRPGGFADYCVVPERSVHRVPDGLALEDAVLAEPLAVVLHALADIETPPDRALVIGHGPVGALVQIELRRRFEDLPVDVAEPAERRAQLARALGARTTGSAPTDGAYGLVVDAAGYEGSLKDAVAAALHGGVVLVLAIDGRPSGLSGQEIVESGVTLRGSNAFVDELPKAVELLAAEAGRYRPLVTGAVSLAELPLTIRQQLASPDEVKVLVRP
jgi:threonine dehydrogenase-like Zn-dependent dehydrogenase